MSLELFKNGGSTGLYRSEDYDILLTVVEGFEVDYNNSFLEVVICSEDQIRIGCYDTRPETLGEFLLPLEFLDVEYKEYEPNEPS